jgi:CIC family chloride channel protein
VAHLLFLTLAMIAGLLAVLYNRSLLATLALVERVGGPIELRAAAIGAAVGLLAWVVPGLVGGGDDITQRALTGDLELALLPAIFLLRLTLGAISYAAATPGGLFAPMLMLGAVSGLGFGLVAERLFPTLGLQPEGFARVPGMTHRPPFQAKPGTFWSAVTGRKDDANKARALPETGCLKEA